MSDYIVYKHTSPSGKVYIGITCQKPARRWRKGEGYKPPDGETTPFYTAIQKYGWENITHEILAQGLSKNEACEMEKALIKATRSQERAYGYNVLKGGDIPLEDCPEEVRAKMRESSFMKWGRAEYIASHTGAEHWTKKQGYSSKAIEAMRKSNLGRKRTPEEVEAIRARAKQQERRRGKDNKKSIPIECLDKDGEHLATYFGAMEAERKTGVCFQNIFKVCNGERKTAGGYIWRYADGGFR